VSKLHADRRGYALLPELNARPRNKYLARVRNPNPKMVPQDAAAKPPAGAAKGGHS
jgi:molybdopterin-containing oxidoreductase family iron-sulfur binding subunit